MSNYTLTDSGYGLIDYPIIAFSDLVVSLDGIKQQLVSFKRDSLGYYNYVDSRPIADYSTINDLSLSTNGEWIFVSNYDFRVTSRQILRIDSNGIFANETYTIDAGQYSWMFDDGSVASFDADGIKTFNFNGTDWTITRTEIPEGYPELAYSWFRRQSNYIYTSVQVSKVPETYEALIMARQPNHTWALVETIPLFDTDLGGDLIILYDGNDTIILGSGTGYGTDGRISVRHRENDWQAVQNITLDTVGIVEYNQIGSFFAQNIQFVDQNTIVATAPHDGYYNQTVFIGGSIIWIERDESSGIWTPTKRATSNNPATFGVGLAVLDKQVITFEVESYVTIDGGNYYGNSTLYLTRAAPCLLEPTDVTCHNLTWTSCDTLPDNTNQLNVSSLYTINTSIGCGQVSVQQSGFARGSQSVMVEFTFTRSGFNDVICTSVISCTSSAPTTSQQPTESSRPSKISVGHQISGTNVLTLLAVFVAVLHM